MAATAPSAPPRRALTIRGPSAYAAAVPFPGTPTVADEALMGSRPPSTPVILPATPVVPAPAPAAPRTHGVVPDPTLQDPDVQVLESSESKRQPSPGTTVTIMYKAWDSRHVTREMVKLPEHLCLARSQCAQYFNMGSCQLSPCLEKRISAMSEGEVHRIFNVPVETSWESLLEPGFTTMVFEIQLLTVSAPKQCVIM